MEETIMLAPAPVVMTDAIDQKRLLAALRRVRSGDFRVRLPLDAIGIAGDIVQAFNDVVELNERMAKEFTRITVVVGREGRVGQRATLGTVTGSWAGCVDSVNTLIDDLTKPTTEVNRVIGAVAKGDLSQRMALDLDGRPLKGEFLRLSKTVNTMVDQLNAFASEVTRVAREVGTEGKLGGQADVRGVAGTWKDLTDSVNSMAGNLTSQVRNIAEVTTAVANGDLSKKITVDVRGEILELKDTINTMVDQLNAFASEVTRVAREVGSEGKLGGQAEVKGVAGTWKDLTDNVNFMASNLTEQVRGIARVVTAVANGDLKRKLTLEAKGEIAALAETINDMIDTLATFADQVTTVAREVGIEGKLGGQAQVPGAAGIWRDLTDNVNELAASLATQVRAIGEVATAVTKGDLSRSIQVAAQGEVELLKDTINEMIRNLRDTTAKNQEQDWLKTNLARFTGMLQGQKDLQTVGKLILSELAPLIDAQHGVFYLNEPMGDEPLLKILATYAYRARKHLAQQFRLGEGLVGQCAYEKVMILLTNVPGDYIEISSGLGAAPPLNIVVLPVLFEGAIKAVIELASFNRFSAVHLSFLEQLTESIGIVLNTLAANSRTEELLKQSQALTMELQKQQQELQQTNEELEEKARLLAAQNQEVERRRREIDEARRALEQKADQLALTSKYKNQFLANMSHELRTPLNSLLILAQQLAENADQNLTAKQVQFAEIIYASGADLLTLINDILDLSKIESGTATVEASELAFAELAESLERTFRAVAEERALAFTISMDSLLPARMVTDATRLHQILKNLLSNAFKFTPQGSVDLHIATATGGWRPEHQALNRATTVIAFAVRDTGIGIPQDKQSIIFESFQQGDMATSRKFGGTGLGLSISRELAHLLDGDLAVRSEPDMGSTFTLYLPLVYQPEPAPTMDLAWMAGVRGPLPAVPGSNGSRADRDTHALMGEDDAQPAQEAIGTEERLLLLVEEDAHFARIMKMMAHERGFKAVVADTEAALRLVRRLSLAAIALDVDAKGGAEWWLLDYLKHDPRTRHIPVQVLTSQDGRQRALQLGAIGHVQKPASLSALGEAFDLLAMSVERDLVNLLVVAGDQDQQQSLAQLLGDDGVQVTVAASGADALAALAGARFDCVVLAPPLPDMTSFDLLRGLAMAPDRQAPPVVHYAPRDLTVAERADLRALAAATPIKYVTSVDQLLDAMLLVLHRNEATVPERYRPLLLQARRTDPVLAGRKVLIVDDDMRNIFALTSALERYSMEVLFAETGHEGIKQLTARPDIDIVLMDIMLPEVDGYETIRRIRAMPDRPALPIIALTAKAMSDDREKCIEAGAWDYISKPVDVGQLLSRLRVWLSQP